MCTTPLAFENIYTKYIIYNDAPLSVCVFVPTVARAVRAYFWLVSDNFT